MKENITPEDKRKLDRSNTIRKLKGYNNGINELSHGKAISFTSAVRFIYNHFDDFKICHDLGIEPEISNLEKHQSKGEAEMAQVDWLLDVRSELSTSMSACSILTSGDIDALPIHLFALLENWPEREGAYIHPVYVILQKPQKKMDIYNVTAIMTEIEKEFKNDNDIVKKISIVLCMGGNDFIPKFNSISHKKMLHLFVSTEHFRLHLFDRRKWKFACQC